MPEPPPVTMAALPDRSELLTAEERLTTGCPGWLDVGDDRPHRDARSFFDRNLDQPARRWRFDVGVDLFGFHGEKRLACLDLIALRL